MHSIFYFKILLTQKNFVIFENFIPSIVGSTVWISVGDDMSKKTHIYY